ncbi:MAG: UDP-N-acetylmuramoyl-tripeptide--D-alanyl-D-alanine ligase [Acidobacteriota bacterium]
MIPLTTDELATAVNGHCSCGGKGTIEEITIDSRRVTPGACFFAITGSRTDGHRYLAEALAAGARTLVLHQRPGKDLRRAAADACLIRVEDTTKALQATAAYVRDQVGPRVLAITGSMGKTTTKDLAAELLRERWKTHATLGNLNNQWGLPLSLLGLQPGHRIMVAELAMSRTGEIGELARLAAPEIGLITNIGPVHMAFFDNLEAVASAKAELAEALPPTGTLIVNADDLRTMAIAERFAGSVQRVLLFGRGRRSTVRAEDVQQQAGGWQLKLVLPEQSPVRLQLHLPGEHSLANFLAAAAAAHSLGLPAKAIAGKAPDLTLPSNRGQVRRLASGVTLIDDSYNASPMAMMRALDTLAGMPAVGRRVMVAGDMLELGSWSERSHRQIGAHAAQLGIDLIVAVGQYAEVVAGGAEAAGLAKEAISYFGTAEEAGATLAHRLEAGDLVLVKGSRALRMERVVETLAAADAGNGSVPSEPGRRSAVEG